MRISPTSCLVLKVVNPPNQVELSAEELAEIQEDEKVKKCEEEKAKWQLWKTIVGNCVIDRTELDDRFETFLLCLHCLHEQMVSAKDIKDRARKCHASSANQNSRVCMHRVRQVQGQVAWFPHWATMCTSTYATMHNNRDNQYQWVHRRATAWRKHTTEQPAYDRTRIVDWFIDGISARYNTSILWWLSGACWHECGITNTTIMYFLASAEQGWVIWNLWRKVSCAVIDQHFDDHSSCQLKDKGGWCKYKGNSKLTSVVHVNGKCHCCKYSFWRQYNDVSGGPKKKPPCTTIQCKNCPNKKGHVMQVNKQCANHGQYQYLVPLVKLMVSDTCARPLQIVWYKFYLDIYHLSKLLFIARWCWNCKKHCLMSWLRFHWDFW